MSIVFDEVFTRGGKELIDLLNYCVRSVQMDPIFVFLVEEYRAFPTAQKAIALYDMFLDRLAPARIDAPDLLPPRELNLLPVIHSLRAQLVPAASSAGSPLPIPPRVQAGKFIFDTLSGYVRENRHGAFIRIQRRYKPELTPAENLPDGKMTQGQRRFVEQVWEPKIRPALVRAGFRRIANIA